MKAAKKRKNHVEKKFYFFLKNGFIFLMNTMQFSLEFFTSPPGLLLFIQVPDSFI